MAQLHQIIAERVKGWRERGFPHEDYPALAEILDYQYLPASQSGARRDRRFLRAAQIEALHTYWYLRLVENTPRMIDLYRSVFPRNSELLAAWGATTDEVRDFVGDFSLDAFLNKVSENEEFVSRNRLEALRETITLDYSSFILALAMGAGKTALIGAIIATEFSLASEYPEGPFVQNALVFAPGLTILGSLRQLAALPYDRILPPRFHKPFVAGVKMIFTRDGDPDIPVIPGSTGNIVVTNTEKIRITKETIRKGDLKGLFFGASQEEARGDLANRRLKQLASLPHLAVFSDEAHHAFGRGMENDLKRVRQTIDYLHEKSPNLIAVVSTTGTPYLNRQPLLDVIYWYGLSAGIRDGILKTVGDNVRSYTISDETADDFVAQVIEDFFARYRDTRLPDGSWAKIAMYFPQVDDLRELRPVVEARLMHLGLSADLVLANHSESAKAEIDAFERLNDPAAPHRVILLVNKGTEGWDCPSLFACALARKLRTSNNFVLQATCRCLRQVPGNNQPASIYLSDDNRRTLEKELQETYGETIRDLERARGESRTVAIKLRKLRIPPLVVKQLRRRVERAPVPSQPIRLERPNVAAPTIYIRTHGFAAKAERGSVLVEGEPGKTVEIEHETSDLYAAAVELAGVYRLEPWPLLDELRRIYPEGALPDAHLPELAAQVERHVSRYTIVEEEIEVALALVKPEGFDKSIEADGQEVYTAEISYPVDRERLLLHWDALRGRNPADLGFHYSPYNFDSAPELEFFERMLDYLNLAPADVEDIYFTGALTSSNRTDFRVEYRDTDGQWRDYTPDFVIRRKDGRAIIVEIKSEQHRAGTEEDVRRATRGEPAITHEGSKAVALKKWTGLNADRLKYQLLFVDNTVPAAALDETKQLWKTLT